MDHNSCPISESGKCVIYTAIEAITVEAATQSLASHAGCIIKSHIQGGVGERSDGRGGGGPMVLGC